MDGARFRQAEAIFEELVATPAAERSSVLIELCGGDLELRSLVERVVENDRRGMGEFLRRPPAAVEESPPAERAFAPRIGRYEILREIGRGGMGVVYEARQEHPKRRVALKVVRQGFASSALQRRFQYEAEMLGRLQHPGIAQIFEAGTAVTAETPAGPVEQPFFAMEFVEGESLTHYVQQRSLSVQQRLDLMARICDAVQHAHLKGIIHRDLKPANILVADSRSETAPTAQPKILDFGLARATGADVYTLTMHTEAGQLIGTIPYMSPEQAEGRTDQLDARSDVYTLGVILYQLVAGRLPYELTDLPIVKAARIISEEPPIPLGSLNRAYRGDLDTIARKALEKDPDRRYASASALAADIRHYLHREPITARPASASYQLKKFAQRNKALVGGMVTTIVALILGVIGTGYGMIQMTRQRDEARLQARIVQAANDFLTDDLLELADPQNEPNRDLPLRVALDRAAAKLEGRFPDSPVLEANLRKAIGKAYRHLDLLEQAEPQLDRAQELYRAARGEHDADFLIVRMELAALLMQRFEFGRAEEMFGELLDIQRAVLGPEHEQTIASLHNLGSIYLQQGRYGEAEPVLRETLEIKRRVLGEENTHTAVTIMNLGVLFQYTGRLAEAAEYLEKALGIHLRVSGEEQPDTLQTIANLGVCYHSLKQYDKAKEMLERALELNRRVLGEEHQDTLAAAGNLGVAYGALGRHEEQEAILRRTLEVQRRILGDDHRETLMTRLKLARAMYEMEEYESAEAEYAQVNALLADKHPLQWFTGVGRQGHGRCLMKLERLDEAEQSLLEAHRILTAAVGDKHERTRQVETLLIELYDRWEKPEQAAQWQAKTSDSQPADEPAPKSG